MKRSFLKKHGLGLAMVSVAAVLTVGIMGCGVEETPLAPTQSTDHSAAMLEGALKRTMATQDRHTAALMADPDVVGTATTLDGNGNPAVMIMAKSQRALNAAPTEIEGIPVIAVYTDQPVALKGSGGGGGGGVSHKAIQTPPIQMGTSGGWRYDLANGYCCGGTLGALVNRSGSQYVLSNYHVLEADIVNGGNSRVAQAGDPVIQPGLIDINCNANSSQNVATLSGIKTLPGSNVDAAIAQVIPGMVRTDGSILAIGTISSSTIAATVGQAVKKSGRTTGLTRNSVVALNATINIAYENECAGGQSFVKTFTGQIVIGNNGSKFLAGGDSGSLLVQDVTTNPRAIGLLFAGSSFYAYANPIGQVLSQLNATMVGN